MNHNINIDPVEGIFLSASLFFHKLCKHTLFFTRCISVNTFYFSQGSSLFKHNLTVTRFISVNTHKYIFKGLKSIDSLYRTIKFSVFRLASMNVYLLNLNHLCIVEYENFILFFAKQDQRDIVEKHTSNGIDFLERCASFVKERIRIEQEYAKSLRLEIDIIFERFLFHEIRSQRHIIFSLF